MHACICLSAFHSCENEQVRGSKVARDGSERGTGVAVLTQLPVALVVARSPSLLPDSFLSTSIRRLLYQMRVRMYTRWPLTMLTDMFIVCNLVTAVTWV